MSNPGTYESDEKDYVRKHLWDAAFNDLIQEIGVNQIRLLELPGAECLYLRHIEEKFGFDLKNCVAVEQYETEHLAIHGFLRGQGILLPRGSLESYFESGKLKAYGPFHIANLDFCGQGFTFPDLGEITTRGGEYQRRWDSIKYLLEWNKEAAIPRWHLLLTLSCNRNNSAGLHYLKDKLDELRGLAKSSRDVSGWDDWQLIQEVVPMIVADEAIHQRYVPLVEHFDSVRYVQRGHKHRMVAWRFGFALDTSNKLGGNHRRHQIELSKFCAGYFKNEGMALSEPAR